MNKPHILYIISSLKLGGAELMLIDIIDGLSEDYHQTVLYFHDGPIRTKLESQAIKCIPVPKLACLYDPYFSYAVISKVRHLNPNIIVSSLWSANFYARLIGAWYSIPTYTINHAQLDHEGIVRNTIDAITMRYAYKVITVAPAITNELINKKWIPSEKVVTIVNGVKLNYSTNTVSRTQLGLSAEHFVIGAVGRFVPVKNFELLINALAQLVNNIPHIRLVLIGSGPLEAKLLEFINKHNLNDHAQILKEVNARDYYHLFDIFVQPSWSEGLSRALLEALAHKVPTIASYNKHKEHDIITHEQNGLLINPADVQSLISTIKQLYDNHNLRKSLADAGYQAVKNNYSYENMINLYKQSLKKAIY